MRRIVTIVVGLILMRGFVRAQQSPLYSQFMFNKFLVNPASAGAEGMTTFNLTSREQWLGVKNAPMTNSLSVQTRYSGKSFINKLHFLHNKYNLANRKGNVGLGLNLFNDTRGLISQTGLAFTYAAHFQLDSKQQLSFGLTSSFTQFNVNKSKLKLEDSEDDLINNNKLNKISPDFNFGAYIISEEWYAGFSANNLLQSCINFSDLYSDKFKYVRLYNVIGGYRFGLDDDYAVEPSFMYKTTESFNGQIDFATRIYYGNLYWGGIGYRTGNTMTFNFGMKYDKFYFGYAFDYSFNAIQSASVGSHEVMITYKIGERQYRKRWLERF